MTLSDPDVSPVSDHAVLRFLERVLGVDCEAVREVIAGDTASARQQGARGCRVNGLVYRFRNGYVTTVFVGEPHAVRRQHVEACKKIMRRPKKVPLTADRVRIDDGFE